MHMLYLCGPINGCSDAEANDWRTLVKSLWKGRTLDPMRRDYRGQEAIAWKEIVELDKADVANSDAVIVSFDRPSVGTSMEILYAWTLGIPVGVVAGRGTIISPWLRYHSKFIVPTYALACSGLADLL